MAVDRQRWIVFAFGLFDREQVDWTWQFGKLFEIDKGQIRWLEAVFHGCFYGMDSNRSMCERRMSDRI
jgi:hypothetical protein